MSPVMEWDELNILRKNAQDFFSRGGQRRKKDLDRFCDYMDWIFCLVYAYGWKDAEEIVGIVTFEDGLDDKAVNHKIDGKTFRDRITEETTPEEILRIVDTEAHRDYNTAVYDAAVKSGKSVFKRWNTMLDNRVRDPHAYMEGMTVGLNDEFYTYGGEHTMFPGGFGVPELDCRCRCFITLVA